MNNFKKLLKISDNINLRIEKSNTNSKNNIQFLKTSIFNIENMSLNIKKFKFQKSFKEFQINANQLTKKINDYLKNPNESLKIKLINQINFFNNSLNNFNSDLSKNSNKLNNFNYYFNQYKNNNISKKLKKTIQNNSKLILLFKKRNKLINKKNNIKKEIFRSVKNASPAPVDCKKLKSEIDQLKTKIENLENTIKKAKEKYASDSNINNELLELFKIQNYNILKFFEDQKNRINDIADGELQFDYNQKELIKVNDNIHDLQNKLAEDLDILTLNEIEKINNQISSLVELQQKYLDNMLKGKERMNNYSNDQAYLERKLLNSQEQQLKDENKLYQEYEKEKDKLDKISEIISNHEKDVNNLKKDLTNKENNYNNNCVNKP